MANSAGRSTKPCAPTWPRLPSAAGKTKLPSSSRLYQIARPSWSQYSSLTRSPRRERKTNRSPDSGSRSEEHTSELQSHVNLVCRLLLEKKKKTNKIDNQDVELV